MYSCRSVKIERNVKTGEETSNWEMNVRYKLGESYWVSWRKARLTFNLSINNNSILYGPWEEDPGSLYLLHGIMYKKTLQEESEGNLRRVYTGGDTSEVPGGSISVGPVKGTMFLNNGVYVLRLHRIMFIHRRIEKGSELTPNFRICLGHRISRNRSHKSHYVPYFVHGLFIYL